MATGGMQRTVRRNRALVIPLLALSLSSCGSEQSAPPPPDPDQPRLLAAYVADLPPGDSGWRIEGSSDACRRVRSTFDEVWDAPGVTFAADGSQASFEALHQEVEARGVAVDEVLRPDGGLGMFSWDATIGSEPAHVNLQLVPEERVISGLVSRFPAWCEERLPGDQGS